ncbi:unnamed protein product [Penicillium salamii]|uniref:Uncharacterized protein n=1 Tax=Penicillium salamii TaxID=1612424 RepID=A0A9W4NBX9_9EURO|nr:unnamed protein product [Penicillium salamii]CAG8004114.1 unnamed protein product [Penicillium salamii]CAG8215422.1 unnamed protein product [Penicillium salamii]CAG8300670.1 unnamed protein product [Penicillium salamii]CAG8324902.1 unnamed protein product [Penicillium salamii]
MFRRPRLTEADGRSLRLSKVLQPTDMIPWANLAMWYLGVPIGLGVSISFSGELDLCSFSLMTSRSSQAPMIVVRDEDYAASIGKFESAGFQRGVPNRAPPPEVLDDLPNPQQVLEEINAGYRRLDPSCTVFDYPLGDPGEEGMQLFLIPDSFAHIFEENMSDPSTTTGDATSTARFHSYGNLHYPLEPTLVESFVKATIDEETDPGFPGYSSWELLLQSWISMMGGYLEVNNDILDNCTDKKAVEWYSEKHGRIHEAKFGPPDLRITKRLGSGKEMPIDMRGNPL